MAQRPEQRIERASERHLDSDSLDAEVTGRYRDILDAAATLFAERGYAATSVRDIGERVGLLGGSLYHHIKSKEALFIKIHDVALQAAAKRVKAAVDGHVDPWERIEAACVALTEIQLDPASVTMPLMNDFRSVPPEVRDQLIERRDAFETLFDRLVQALPLDPVIDRKTYRLMLLTLVNNISTWYRPGGLTPTEIGRQVAIIFRHELLSR